MHGHEGTNRCVYTHQLPVGGCPVYSPEEDLARWCLLPASRCSLRGGAGCWEAAAGARAPSLRRVSCRVCSANSVWIRVRSRPETLRPFSTKISSPGRRPVRTAASFRGSGGNTGGEGVFQRVDTFVKSQAIWKNFVDKNPAVFLAVYVSRYGKALWETRKIY